MKRRKILTSAGALAGAALTGCGGGGEDGALGGDPSSQIGAYTVPATLVPANAQWHVEVVFHTTAKVFVDLACGTNNGARTLVASKEVTLGTSHRINFSTLLCNNTTAYSDYTKVGLFVKEYWSTATSGGSVDTYHGYGMTSSAFFKYTKHTDLELAEHEWVCYSSRNGAHLCTVRFFILLPDEVITFNTGEYVRRVIPTSTHANSAQNTRVYPLHHATTLRMEAYEVAVFHDATNKSDTICLPNPRQAGHDELVPSYLAASDAEKPHLRRRLKRHVQHFSKATRSSYFMDTQDDQAVHNLLGNEIVRTLGGKSLVDHLNTVRDGVRTSVQNNLQQMGTAFDAFCTNRLPALTSQAMYDQTRALLDTAENGEKDSRAAGGCGVSTSVQFSMSVTEADFPWPGINLGGGFRVSVGLARASKKWNSGVISAADLYKVSDIASKGTKLGITIILKGFDGSSCLIGGISADIEATINFTIIDGHWRVDVIQFDPVLDIDTRKFAGEMVAWGMERLLSTAVGGVQAIAALPASMGFGVPAFASGMGDEMGVFAGQLFNSAAELAAAKVKSKMDPMLQTMRDALGFGSVVNTRTWATLEFSPLRITIANSDVGDSAIPFRGGFRYGGTGWQPGVKYITAFGVNPSYPVPYYDPKVTTVKPPGTITFAGFLRVSAVADVYSVYGPPNFIRAVSFPWAL